MSHFPLVERTQVGIVYKWLFTYELFNMHVYIQYICNV